MCKDGRVRFGLCASASLAGLVLGALVSTAAAHPVDIAGGDQSWAGKPAMISNLGVYRGGEFIYQDYVYDDHGANTDGIDRQDLIFGVWPDPQDPTDPRLSPTGGSVRYTGDFLYASSNDHYDNVADLIEFRVTTDTANVYYLARLGTLTAADQTVVAICVNEDGRTDTGLGPWPLGSGLTDRLGCDHLYTVFGTGAYVTDGAGNTSTLDSAGGAVAADVDRNTLGVRVPRSVADPGSGTWRYYVASGLWDSANGSWLAVPPVPQLIGAPLITGGGIGAPNIWDLLSNNREPNSYWREEKQANDLVNQSILDDYVDVDFARLAQPLDDGEPRVVGVLNRLYVSSFAMNPAEGIDIDRSLGTNFQYNGRYQPYAMAVPSDYFTALAANPSRRFPFDLCMHPLNGNHMVEIYYSEAFARDGYNPLVSGTIPMTGYLGFSYFESLIDRLDGLYACVLGHGEGIGYTGGDGLVDVLEVMDDVEKSYRVDPDHRTVHGVSLGAIGTWYVSRLYPDRFSAAMPYIFTSGIPADTSLLENLYDLPVFYAIGTLDQFGQGTQGDTMADRLQELGNEYLYLHYLGRQHEGVIEADFLPFTEALAYPRLRATDPARVRYVFDPGRFSPEIPGDGSAYWVSGMTPAQPGAVASIEVTSLARADELPKNQVVLDGIYYNLRKGYLARIRGLFRASMEEFEDLWRPADFESGWEPVSVQATPTALTPPSVANAFNLEAAELGAVSLDTARMEIDPSLPVDGTLGGDGTLELTLIGSFPQSVAVTFDGSPIPATNTGDALRMTLDLSATPKALHIE